MSLKRLLCDILKFTMFLSQKIMIMCFVCFGMSLGFDQNFDNKLNSEIFVLSRGNNKPSQNRSMTIIKNLNTMVVYLPFKAIIQFSMPPH